MYSNEYEEGKVSNESNGNFYQNNKKLVWIFIAIVLVVIIVVILKNKTGSSNSSTNTVSIAVYPETDVTVAPGNTYKLFAQVNNNPNAVITWTSSDEKIATVDGGIVTGVDYGKVTITASYLHSDNKKYDAPKEVVVAEGKANVTVTEVSIKEGDLLMPVGGTYIIGLNVVPSNGYISSKVFTSSNEGVATVDNKGTVTAISEGNATITINVNNGAFNKVLNVYVSNDYDNPKIVVNPTKITLNKESNKIKVGGTVKLSYTVIPSEAKGSYITWTSSDESVLTVDKSGVITAVKEGKATVKAAAANDINDTLDIEVVPDEVLITEINLSIDEIYIEGGQTQTVTPVIVPETATNKALTYESSDESIMTVEATNEGTSCLITGVSSGTATLKIKASTGEATKEVTVTVGGDSYTDSGSSGSSGGGGSCASCDLSKVKCAAGKYCHCGKCYTCKAGYRCSGNKQTKCPANTTSKAGAIYCTATSCPAGQGANDPAISPCAPCGKGYYSGAGSTKCTKCPTGKTTSKSSGAVSISDCNVSVDPTYTSVGYCRNKMVLKAYQQCTVPSGKKCKMSGTWATKKLSCYGATGGTCAAITCQDDK